MDFKGASGVYLICNLRTGRPYVGSAQKFGPRWAQHLQRLRRGKHHSWKLQKDFDVFGEAAFEFKPLLVCEVGDLLFFESRAIEAFKAVDEGYNVSREAGAPMRGLKHTEETKEKMRGPRAPFSPESRGRMSAAQLLRAPASEDTREKLRQARALQAPASEETRKKLSDAGMGRKMPASHPERLREQNHARKGLPGRPLTEEHKQKLVVSNVARTGTKVDPAKAEELREKKRAGWAARKAAGLKRGDGRASKLKVHSDTSTSTF